MATTAPSPAVRAANEADEHNNTTAMELNGIAAAVANDGSDPNLLYSPKVLAETAKAIISQEWNEMGFESDHPATIPTSDINVLKHRITALLICRCAVLVSPKIYPNASTISIAETILDDKKKNAFPRSLNETVIAELSEFVHRMIVGYKDVPYHNREHAYHVVISATKLMEMMIVCTDAKKKTYGLKNDPLSLFALVFSGLIHDVEHQGIPNRQLAMEDDRLAVLYNDQSMAENWSLYVAFSEFLQDEFKNLRNAILPQETEYRRFRKIVVTLVLCTDIASPERTQIGKSKWKEAFGDPFETVERKMRRSDSQRRMSMTGRTLLASTHKHRRGSAVSALGSSQLNINYNANDEPPINASTHTSNNVVPQEEDEDDASLSGTPEPSETSDNEADDDDDDADAAAAAALANPATTTMNKTNNNATAPPPPHQRPLVVPRSPVLNSPDNHGNKVKISRFERRMSAASQHTNTSKYRQRLGILRTVDLSGETLETYERRGSCHASVVSSASPSIYSESIVSDDEPDELKATVVLEIIMTAADVAHNLQGWEHMVKWSGRLYMELRRAYVAKRGSDPKEKWFENQIGFLESYLLPVARKLEDTGVFGEDQGVIFAYIVEANRDRWLTHGFEEAQKVIAAGAKRYPFKKK